MSNNNTTKNAMNTCAIRRVREYDDEFFIPGNQLSHQDSDMVLSYIEVHGSDNDNDDVKEQSQSESSPPEVPVYFCPMMGCDEYFTSLIALEDHYESTHVFQCRITPHSCQRYFPNEHLLDLHITECHDTYFQAMVEKSQKDYQTIIQNSSSSSSIGGSGSNFHNNAGHYRCLVMDCKERFMSDDERLKHLNTVHGYPKWFRFHSRCTPTHTHTRNRRRHRTHDRNSEIHDCKAMDSTGEVRMEDDGDGNDNDANAENRIAADNPPRAKALEQEQKQEQIQKKERRKARRKAKNKTIRCKYYHSKRGCWRGDKCMFLHGDIDHNDGGIDETGDTVMDMGIATDKRSDPNVCIEVLDTEHNMDLQTCTDRNASTNMNMDVDAEMEELTQKMQTKVKITIPQNISFGRRRRRV